MSLKLITINIEGSHHLDKIIPWIKEEKPDLVCMQEVFAVDVPLIAEATGLQPSFVPISRVEKTNKYDIPPKGIWGIGMFSKYEPNSLESYYYKGDGETIPEFTDPNSVNRALLVGTFVIGETEFTIGTTHFTWSPGGKATEEQWRHLEKLQKIVSQFDELVLCGDFNAPRGGEVFAAFTEMFTDHLPTEITSTIDPNLHYAAPLELVVDTIFSTKEYQVKNVRTKSGVSDHQAIVGEVDKTAALN